MNTVWILGGAGRAGQAIAKQLKELGLPITLVGRNEKGLRDASYTLGLNERIAVFANLADIAGGIAREKPRVVINTIGPFMKTAVPIVQACPPGVNYLDIGNELPQFIDLFSMHDELARSSRTVVPGAAWGVLATESLVLHLCEGRSAPARVRVDSIAAVDASGPLGTTLAETIVEGIRYGGRRYSQGVLQSCLSGSDQQIITLPDGSTAKSASIASGELEAAYRASKAENVVACFAGAPGGPVRFVVPLMASLLAIPGLRQFAIKKLANLQGPPAQRKESWAAAHIEWADGSSQRGWLRAGDAYDFLAKTAAYTAQRLFAGATPAGCFTPGTLFGPEIAIRAGGEFLPE
jgi:short subunit dehydrogenase-like uncharacterized protein